MGRMSGQEPPANKIGEGTVELTDGSKYYRLAMVPMIRWLGLDTAEFLGPHEGDDQSIGWLWQDHGCEDVGRWQ